VAIVDVREHAAAFFLVVVFFARALLTPWLEVVFFVDFVRLLLLLVEVEEALFRLAAGFLVSIHPSLLVTAFDAGLLVFLPMLGGNRIVICALSLVKNLSAWLVHLKYTTMLL
jgi:hypothetical protein